MMLTPAEIMIAEQLALQGFNYWNDFIARRNKGELTRDDLNEAGAKLDADIDVMVKARQDQLDAEQAAKDALMKTDTSNAPPTTKAGTGIEP